MLFFLTGIQMWWKTEEGIISEADFLKFRQKILNTPVKVNENNGIVDISVETQSGKLGLKTDIANRKRLEYYNPAPFPNDFLFNVDGVEIGRPVMEKYIQN